MRSNCFRSWLVVVSALQIAGKSRDNSVIAARSSAVKFHSASRSACAYVRSSSVTRSSFSFHRRSNSAATKRFEGSTASYCRWASRTS